MISSFRWLSPTRVRKSFGVLWCPQRPALRNLTRGCILRLYYRLILRYSEVRGCRLRRYFFSRCIFLRSLVESSAREMAVNQCN